MFEAFKIVLRKGNNYVSAFSGCRKRMELGKHYKSDKAFYVWKYLQDAKDMFLWLLSERADTLRELGIPPEELALTKVKADKVEERYLEIGGKWPEGLPAMKVKEMEITEEINMERW